MMEWIEKKKEKEIEKVTESIVDKIVEGVAIAIVSELIVGGGKFVKALGGYSGEIAGEFCILSENYSSTRNETVDQGLLPHGRR
ncbi:hypothetical protein E5676_scaffold1142G00520 [Cucumis melo var. makuwa]|uniref:Uncharacterized protein n=1 Tax=Cucumis melo var. makuwa TaxID=1194695 RepID=A0A5D3DVT5_CUCMM|nr:hypothetical protein E5676_scaffold1142G00520 [Cucumis melo var. makuwa]